MKNITKFAALAAFATSAHAADNNREIGYDKGELGYAALVAGDNDTAVKQLEKSYKENRQDPAKMINLGQAYARAGRFVEAANMFRAAIESNRHFDVELSDGRVFDTREVARMSLKRLQLKSAAR